MRCGIVYFSQTGNTEKIARAIQGRICATAGACDIMRLEETDPRQMDRYDLLGLGCPAFYFREPLNVSQFMQSLPWQLGKCRPAPFFTFVTHGGTPGHVFHRISQLASSRGMRTVGCFSCLGVDTYPPFLGRRPLSGFGHPNDQDLDRARRFAADIVQPAGDVATADDKRTSMPGGFVDRIMADLFDRRGLRLMARSGMLPAKQINIEKCTTCRLCAESCPVRIIELNPYPSFREADCIYCYNCQRACPAEAIECNWVPLKVLSGEYLRACLGRLIHSKKTTKNNDCEA